jgi:hypothetical protein
LVRPLGRDKGGWPLDAAGGGDGNPRRREYSELARLCFECSLKGLPGSGGVSRFADEVARRRAPGSSVELLIAVWC